MRVDWARFVGWAIPLACMALAAFLIFNQHGKLGAASQSLATARLEENTASVARDNAERESGSMRLAAVPPDKSEEPVFLDGLRGHASKSHIQIAKWTEHLPEPMVAPPTVSGPSMGSPSPDPSTIDPAIQQISRIKGDLTLEGSYQGIRTFINMLSKSNRLYILSNTHWIGKGESVEFTATLTRFIDPTLTPADVAAGAGPT